MKFLIVYTLILAIVAADDLSVVQEKNNATGRIISGQIAQAGQFPYQVSIFSVFPGDFSLVCSGAIIASNWIVAAAQCLDFSQHVTIGYGSTVRSSPQVSLAIPSSDIIIHPAYFNVALTNDIALIRVPTIEYNDSVQPVKLPAETDASLSYVGEFGIISGWGKITNADDGPSDDLYYGRMPIISNDECKVFYGMGPIIQPSTLCASTMDGVSFCYGDNGAPLVSEITGELLGLTSFGALYPSCTMNTPDAFTRITSYLGWIKSITGVHY